MPRLTLAARLALTVVIALILAWVVSLSFYFRTHGGETEGIHPAPARLTALVGLAETLPPAQRAAMFQAVGSDLFRPMVEPAGTPPPDRPSIALEAGLRAAYETALAGRVLAVVTAPLPPNARLMARYATSPRNALEFRIALKTGETLVLDTRNPLMVTSDGLPVGFGAAVFGTLIALAALVVMHRAMRPLARLAAAVDRMDPAGEPVPLPPGGAPEIQALGRAFNRLQERMAGLLKARMAMLGGISHDVRTFATRLRLRVDRIPVVEERERAIADIADMIRLLDDALLASRAGAGELAQELVELDEILSADVADRQAQGADIALAIAPAASGAALLGDRLALRRIAGNLIDNALRYGSAVRVGLGIEAAQLVLTVDDDGPGIPAAQREVLLEPFVRLETSRNRRTGGAGLGLAVVRSLAEALGGSVAISDAPIGGARVSVRLPLFQPG